MKVMHPWRLVLAACLALPYVAALAQDLSVPDLIKGEKLASTMKADDLPTDYKAVRLKVSGDSSYLDMLSGPLGMMMMFSPAAMHTGNGNEAAQAELFSMIQLSWTKGEVVHLMSAGAAASKAANSAYDHSVEDQYLVTYTPDFDMSKMMTMTTGGATKGISTDLKLVLVKLTSISSITPVPDVTKEQFVKVLSNSGSLMASQGTPTAATATPGAPSDAATTTPVAVAQVVQDQSPAQTRAVSNAKQLALGSLMYCSDYDDVLPYVQSVVTVKEVTYPYMKNLDVWKTGNPASQWRFNMCLGGVSQTEIAEPASTPLFYESAPWADGRRVVAFADGHVKLVGSAEWKGMAKYLKLKLKRSAKKPLPVHQPGMNVPGSRVIGYGGPVPPQPAPARAGGR